jgi:hypothetical protein
MYPGICVLLVGLLYGIVVLGWGRSEPAETLTSADVPASSDGPTTTTIALDGRDYAKGDCVTWDQTPGGHDQRLTDVVPCTRAHLIEITGPVGLPSGDYPADWDALIEARCRPLADRHLRRPLDPAGRFYATAIYPLPETWAGGDHTLWCGIGVLSPDASVSDRSTPFKGRVEGQDDTFLWGTGSCLALDADGERWTGTVSCDQPHGYEITGSVTLTGVDDVPVDADRWNDAAWDACDPVSKAYLGGAIPRDVEASFVPIAQTSWNRGRRLLECMAGRVAGEKPVASTGSLRS